MPKCDSSDSNFHKQNMFYMILRYQQECFYGRDSKKVKKDNTKA